MLDYLYYRKLTKVFQIEEMDFFKALNAVAPESEQTDFLKAWQEENQRLLDKIPELPFSNVWIAQQKAAKSLRTGQGSSKKYAGRQGRSDCKEVVGTLKVQYECKKQSKKCHSYSDKNGKGKRIYPHCS